MTAALIIVFVMFLVALWRAWSLTGKWQSANDAGLQQARTISRLDSENRQLTRDLREARETRDNVVDLANRADAERDAEDDEDDDWPDEWEIWRYYADARMAAHGAGCDFKMSNEDGADRHVALSAAQTIGQTEGARLRAQPELAIKTVAELNREVERLLGVADAPASATTDVSGDGNDTRCDMPDAAVEGK